MRNIAIVIIGMMTFGVTQNDTDFETNGSLIRGRWGDSIIIMLGDENGGFQNCYHCCWENTEYTMG